MNYRKGENEELLVGRGRMGLNARTNANGKCEDKNYNSGRKKEE
jgi:hypothetical protein